MSTENKKNIDDKEKITENKVVDETVAVSTDVASNIQGDKEKQGEKEASGTTDANKKSKKSSNKKAKSDAEINLEKLITAVVKNLQKKNKKQGKPNVEWEKMSDEEKKEHIEKYQREMKCRVWEVQSHVLDGEGDPLFTQEHVDNFLRAHEKEISRWAYVTHNKDKYSQDDVNANAARHNGVPTISMSQDKPSHIHLVLEYPNPKTMGALADEIGMPLGQIQKAKSPRNQFMAIASYFTHEDWKQQELGKYRYPDSEIHHSTNFDYRKEVDAYFKNRKNTATNMGKTRVNAIINQLACGEIKSLEVVKQRYGYAFYQEYEQKFQKAHVEFIRRHYEMKARINYVIDGPSGYGKSSLAEMLARCLNPDLDQNDAYFVAGGKGVKFDGYNYQPCIIWDDERGDELRGSYSATEMLNILEIHPKKRSYNVKYGQIILVNQVNIFTTIQAYDDFIEALSLNEDINQFTRRIPIVLRVHPECFDILINESLFDSKIKTQGYKFVARIPLNIYSVNNHFAGKAKMQIFMEALRLVIRKHEDFLNRNIGLDIVTESLDDDIVELLSINMQADEIEESEKDMSEEEILKKLDEKRDYILKDVFELIPITDKKELDKIEAKQEDDDLFKRYFESWQNSKEAKVLRETMQSATQEEYEEYVKKEWEKLGCPETHTTKRVDTYLNIKNEIIAQRALKWYEESKCLYDIMELINEDEIAGKNSEDNQKRFDWYRNIILRIYNAYEIFAKTKTQEDFNKCLAVFSLHFDDFKKDTFMLRQIAEIALKEGYIEIVHEAAEDEEKKRNKLISALEIYNEKLIREKERQKMDSVMKDM